MTLKEANRLEVMKRKERKEINLKKAAEELGLCYKQTRRIWKKYQKGGASELISKRRGKPSRNRLSEDIKIKALSFVKEKYYDYGPTLAKEKLEEKHNLYLSKETLRQLMIKEGIWKAKKTKEIKVHPRRTRRSRFGSLIQIDGSYHLWFEDRDEKCCLLVSIDDATSAITYMKFCKAETVEAYYDLVKNYLDLHGRPLAFYSDRHQIFRVNNKKKLEGPCSTQFQGLLKELDIELICAYSPQAKGRVEKANRTLQDRLIKELRERGISTVEEGNAFLEEYRKIHNKKFAVEPADKEDAHRAVLNEHKKAHLWMKKEERKLSKDLSFSYKKELYQIDSDYKNRLSGKKVTVYESKGEIKMVFQEEKQLSYRKWKEKIEIPTKILDVKELESSWKPKVKKPSRRHPWR